MRAYLQKPMRKLVFLFFFLIPLLLTAQSTSLCIEDIIIIGNKKTRKQIIQRELDIKKGDCFPLPELSEIIDRNQRQILNSGLFTKAQINVENWNDDTGQITLSITVQENWYFYPIPIFELADRNFNVWWSEQNRSLNRVNFGLRLYQLNITGRNDFLKLVAQYGYTQKYELEYGLPSFNKNQTLGFWTNWFFSRNREIAYRTEENKLLFDRSDQDFQIRRLRFISGLRYRPGLFNYHEGSLGFHQNTITNSVATILNPDYFLDGRKQQRFLSLSYSFTIDKRDIKPYPLNGFYFQGNLRKDGIGAFKDRNTLTLSLTLAKYFSLSPKFSLEFITKGHAFFIRRQQAYHNNRAFGFEPDFLRGYELYVIDGLDFAYLKSSIRFEIFKREIDWGDLVPLSKFKLMPIRIYLSFNNDLGYANDPYFELNNPLSNRMLWGGGFGLDIIAYHNKIIQIQYSVNHLWEKGLYLHHKFIF